MSKRAGWSTPLPRPITLPQVMTLTTLADVRKLLDHIRVRGVAEHPHNLMLALFDFWRGPFWGRGNRRFFHS